MENATPKTYRCTDHGSDASAHEDGIYFVVHAGSRFGVVRNGRDKLITDTRSAISADLGFEDDGLTLKEDTRFICAENAARVVTGCLCDETSWVAPDGSHPTARK